MDLDGNIVKAAADPPPAPKPAATKGPVMPPAKLKQLEQMFKLADEDGNGKLSKQEIQDSLCIEDDAMETLWKAADTDGDGEVTFEEWKVASDAIDAAQDDALAGLP